jgi:hypothetical protein
MPFSSSLLLNSLAWNKDCCLFIYGFIQYTINPQDRPHPIDYLTLGVFSLFLICGK